MVTSTPLPSLLTQPQSKADFGLPEKVKPCSAHRCANGHEWPIRMVVVQCPGCGADMLALMMVQCPMCNEPTMGTNIRIDHLAQGGGIMPLCKGGGSLGELLVVELTHTHAAKEEERYVEREVISKP